MDARLPKTRNPDRLPRGTGKRQGSRPAGRGSPSKRNEDARREGEARFRSAFETTGHGMAITALDGRFVDVNEALTKIVGYGQDELQRRDFQSITHPDDLEVDLGYMKRLLAGEDRTFEMEKRYVHKDGRTIWVQLNVGLIRGPRGQPLYFVAQIHDITEREEEERARRLTEAALTQAQKLAKLGYYRWSKSQQKLIECNDDYLRIFGLAPGSIAGNLKGVEPYLHPDDRRRVIQAYRAVEAEGRAVQLEFRILRTDGAVRYLSDLNEPELSAAGPPDIWFGTVQDITEQKQREAELLEARTRLADAARRAKLAYWRRELGPAGAAGAFVWSEGTDTIFARPVEELPANDEEYLRLVHPEDVQRVTAAYSRAVANVKAYQIEYRILRPDGKIIWLHEFGEVEANEGDKPISYFGILQDITERKQLEVRLSELATVDELTGAHNRRYLQTYAAVEIQRAHRFKRPLSFLFLDIDHFKLVNDRFGHAFGDFVLASFSDVCRKSLRSIDLFARYGGEEFVVMLPETNLDAAVVVAEKLAHLVRNTEFSHDPPFGGLTVSIGASMLHDQTDTLAQIMHRMDEALYRAKARGRDRIETQI